MRKLWWLNSFTHVQYILQSFLAHQESIDCSLAGRITDFSELDFEVLLIDTADMTIAPSPHGTASF
jgi:hypothetical protein